MCIKSRLNFDRCSMLQRFPLNSFSRRLVTWMLCVIHVKVTSVSLSFFSSLFFYCRAWVMSQFNDSVSKFCNVTPISCLSCTFLCVIVQWIIWKLTICEWVAVDLRKWQFGVLVLVTWQHMKANWTIIIRGQFILGVSLVVEQSKLHQAITICQGCFFAVSPFNLAPINVTTSCYKPPKMSSTLPCWALPCFMDGQLPRIRWYMILYVVT